MPELSSPTTSSAPLPPPTAAPVGVPLAAVAVVSAPFEPSCAVARAPSLDAMGSGKREETTVNLNLTEDDFEIESPYKKAKATNDDNNNINDVVTDMKMTSVDGRSLVAGTNRTPSPTKRIDRQTPSERLNNKKEKADNRKTTMEDLILESIILLFSIVDVVFNMDI
jgi:hypothetical protein